LSQIQFKAGAAECYVGVPAPSVTVPSLAGMAFTASGAVASLLQNNSNRTPLSQSNTYQVALTLTGLDTTNGGWGNSVSTNTSGNIVLTGSQNVIAVTINNANWPANYQYASFVSVWLSTNGGNFQFCTAAPVDTVNNMVILVQAAPLGAVQTIPLSQLQASSANYTTYPALGTRQPVGVTFVDQSPTTKNVTIKYTPAAKVTFTPNNAADFVGTGARSATISYQTEANDIDTFVRASFGDSADYTVGNITYIGAAMGINTGSVYVPGNRPFVMATPINPQTGVAQYFLFTSLALINMEEITQNWSKTEETPTPFVFQTTANDYMFLNAPTIFGYQSTATFTL
jgi:hypothetical protein